MPKYFYRPIKDIVLSSYQENSGSALEIPPNFADDVILIVEAPTEQISEKIRTGFTDIRMWEKVNQED